MHTFITNVRYALTSKRERRISMFMLRTGGIRHLFHALCDPYGFGGN